nr:hypothetical protein [Micromonospora sp. DSM 115978]
MTDQTTAGGAPPDEYLQAAVQRLLTEDPEVAEQGITATLRGHALVLCGEVESTQRREEILRLVMTRFPDVPIQMDVGLIRTQPPTEAEDLR